MKNRKRIASVLLCVCLLLPLLACASSDGGFMLTFQPQGDDKISTMVRGVTWGMTQAEVAEVIDLQGADLSKTELTVHLQDGKDIWKTYRRKVNDITFYFANPVDYKDVHFAGGLYSVKIDFVSTEKNAKAKPFVRDFQAAYGKGHGNLTKEVYNGPMCGSGADVCYGNMDEAMSLRRQSMIEWLLQAGSSSQEVQESRLAEFMELDDAPNSITYLDRILPFYCIYVRETKMSDYYSDLAVATDYSALFATIDQIMAAYSE